MYWCIGTKFYKTEKIMTLLRTLVLTVHIFIFVYVENKMKFFFY